MSRAYNWASIGYVESLVLDWLNLLESTYIACAISPLHDRDVMETGEVKKAHYHLLMTFESLKSRNQVIELVKPLGFIMPISVNSVQGYYEYLCHLNNESKAQYKRDDIVHLNHFDGSKFFGKKLTAMEYLTELERSGTNSLSDFTKYLIDSNLYDMVNSIHSHVYLLNTLIRDGYTLRRGKSVNKC